MAPIILPEDAFELLMLPRVVAGRLGWLRSLLSTLLGSRDPNIGGLDCRPQDIWEARYHPEMAKT